MSDIDTCFSSHLDFLTFPERFDSEPFANDPFSMNLPIHEHDISFSNEYEAKLKSDYYPLEMEDSDISTTHGTTPVKIAPRTVPQSHWSCPLFMQMSSSQSSSELTSKKVKRNYTITKENRNPNYGKPWTLEEQQRYNTFIKYNRQYLHRCPKMKRQKYYQVMSSYIGTRNSKQCKSHDQKKNPSRGKCEACLNPQDQQSPKRGKKISTQPIYIMDISTPVQNEPIYLDAHEFLKDQDFNEKDTSAWGVEDFDTFQESSTFKTDSMSYVEDCRRDMLVRMREVQMCKFEF